MKSYKIFWELKLEMRWKTSHAKFMLLFIFWFFFIKVLPLGKPLNGWTLSEKYVRFSFVDNKRFISYALETVGITHKIKQIKRTFPWGFLSEFPCLTKSSVRSSCALYHLFMGLVIVPKIVRQLGECFTLTWGSGHSRIVKFLRCDSDLVVGIF